MRWLCAALIFVVMAGASVGQDRPVQSVIGSQIEAFQQDDFETAFTYASPAIRGIFGTSERFGQMVRQGFPMVWRPADVQYLDQRNEGGFTYQRVRIQDADGAYYMLEYQMLDTQNGWRINGVVFVEPPEVSA